jgi:hypothetical protein
LIAYLLPLVIAALSSIQQTWASISWATVGTLWGRQSMSPRLMSRWSFRVTVTDIGGKASSTGPSAVSIDSIVVSRPLGSTRTGSAGLITPEATVPA